EFGICTLQKRAMLGAPKKYLLQLSLSEEGTVQIRLFISNNQSGDVRRTLVTSDMFIVPKYRS
ncbi:MAG: hypothetical protein ACLRRK_12090, partial [Parasutterella sp.]